MAVEAAQETLGQVTQVPFADHMRRAYIGYALDVVRNRALPDARDGLKPVQRRILYDMYELGLHPSSAYKKSARVTGDVLGKYHPHGDQSVYDAMVVMAQNFKMRYPLVDGHGNFGDVDGSPAAAMRYTEARLSRYGERMLAGIDKETVNFVPNYDESEEEPAILPGLFPALLCNGSEGIAVGMASRFLPHNASAVYKAADKMLDDAINDRETDIEDIIKIIQAPDFPTGGVIVNQPDIWEAYRNGTNSSKARCIVRSKYHFEDYKKDRTAIVVTEIPYGVNKSHLVYRIAKLAEENDDFAGIKEARDESDRSGMRIVIELKKDVPADIMVNRLLKATDMQASLPMNHNCVVDGHIRMHITLQDMLEIFLMHAMEVTQRKVSFELKRLKARLHILEGLMLALVDSDATIELVKAENRKAAVANLKKAYELDDEQAEAVVNLHFYSLNEEDKNKLEEEYKKLDADSKAHEAILSDEKNLLKFVREELASIQQKYFAKDERLTEISTETDDRDTVPDMNVVIAYTHNGYIKSIKEEEYTAQNRNGKGSSFKVKEGDFVESLYTLSTHDDLVVITSSGKAYVLPAYKISVSSKSSVGKPINNYVKLSEGEKVIKFMVLTKEDIEKDNLSILLVTRKGIGKRLSPTDLPHTSSGAKILTTRTEDDSLVSVSLVNNDGEVIVVSCDGQLLRFPVDKISMMGRAAAGVCIMKLRDEDEVVSAFSVREGDTMLQVMQSGTAKRVSADEIPAKVNRGSHGVKGLSDIKRVGSVVAAGVVKDDDDIIVVTQNGQLIRTGASNISVQSRTANGVGVIQMNGDDVVASVTIVSKEQADEQ